MEADESSLLSLSDPNFDIRIEYENDNDNTEISQVGCIMFTEISHMIYLFLQLHGEPTASQSGVSHENDNTEISQVGCMMFTEISLVINLFTQLLSEATASESGVSQHLSEPQASLSSVSLCSPQIDDTSQHSPDSPPSPSNEESLPELGLRSK